MKLNNVKYTKDGLVILFGTIVHCGKNVEKVTVPAYVTDISEATFKNCKSLKEICSESASFISRNGCLYSAKDYALIITVCGEVTVPKEVKKLRKYSCQNCTAISFEQGCNIMKVPNDEKNITYEVSEAIRNEVNKNNAKQSKIKEIFFVSVNALVKSLSAANEIEIKQFRDENMYILSVPIGDGGIDIDLTNEDIMQCKESLMSLFRFISDGCGVWDAIDYCKEHNISISPIGIKYDVIPKGMIKINKTLPGYFCNFYFGNIIDSRSIESFAIPSTVKKIGKNAFFNYICLRNFIFDGTMEQWHKIKKAKKWFYPTDNVTVHCIDGNVELIGNDE